MRRSAPPSRRQADSGGTILAGLFGFSMLAVAVMTYMSNGDDNVAARSTPPVQIAEPPRVVAAPAPTSPSAMRPVVGWQALQQQVRDGQRFALLAELPDARYGYQEIAPDAHAIQMISETGALLRNTSQTIELRVRTGTDGDLDLARQRGDFVRTRLIGVGIAPERIRVTPVSDTRREAVPLAVALN